MKNKSNCSNFNMFKGLIFETIQLTLNTGHFSSKLNYQIQVLMWL